MTEIKLRKAERDMLRFAFLDRHVGGDSPNSLDVSSIKTKRNAALRAVVEHLRELGLVEGVTLTDEGFALGKALHEQVTAERRAWLTKKES